MTGTIKTLWLKIPILVISLLGLPALGVIIAGDDIGRYLEFPPLTQFIVKAPFSPIAFTVLLIPILLAVIALVIMTYATVFPLISQPATNKFPWWGWTGCFILSGCWIIAWNRFTWAEPIQEHTFFPLWAAYIVVINALTFRRTGRSMLTHRLLFFLVLFPVSAGFWWFFEYLNRFVQNWSYTGTQYGAFKYFLLASLAFSTVLPAVLGTKDFLLSFMRLKSISEAPLNITINHPRKLAVAILGTALAGLTLIGVFPDYLFPLIWVSPLLIIVALKTLFGEQHLLNVQFESNRQTIIAAMIAALVCGFFWEMWNYGSLIKWTYEIPLVDRFMLFEMPVLGYAGYLPFGLECAVIGESVNAVAGTVCKGKNTTE